MQTLKHRCSQWGVVTLLLLGGVLISPVLAQTLEEEYQGKLKKESAAWIAGGRYYNNGDGTVYDKQHNLTWQRCPMGQSGAQCQQGEAKEIDWWATKDYAQTQAGWRLPTKEELRTLVYCSNGIPAGEAWDETCSGKNQRGGWNFQFPTINQQAFPYTPPNFFWSSSPYADDGNGVWVVGFGLGNVHRYGKRHNSHVRLVRSGQ